jgi:HK97 family phage portal protein
MTTLGLQQPEKRGGFDDPTSPLTAVAIWNEMDGGPTASGEMVTERTAMAVSTVYTAVTVIGEAVASLPCKLMRRVDKGRQEAIDNYLYELLAYSPNPEMTAFTFWSSMVGCSALTGNAYAEIRRDPDGGVNSIWPLHPLKTEPTRKSDGTLAFRTNDGMQGSAYRIIESKDILHFPLFSMNGIRGVGPVAAARETYALAKAAEKFGARWFGNGAHVPSILINKGPKPDPKVQRELSESWSAAHGGSNANKQGFLFGDWDVKTVGLSPEDSQFLGTRNYQRADIAAMFHLQPHQVGDTSRLSNANHTQAQLSFVTDCLRPILTRIEAELKRKLFPRISNLFVLFDLTERLRGDIQAQMQSYSLSRQWGIMTANECREDMGLNPVGPEGDVLLFPVNMANSEQLPAQAKLVNIDEQEPQPANPDPQNPKPKKKTTK